MKDVLITVKSRQFTYDDTNDIELKAIGKYGLKNGKIYISYDDSKALSENNVSTLIKADGANSIVLQRSGDLNSRMVIEKGKKNRCFYKTDIGHIVLGVFGESITNSLGENGGELKFDYTLDVDSGLLSRNTVEISVREV